MSNTVIQIIDEYDGHTRLKLIGGLLFNYDNSVISVQR